MISSFDMEKQYYEHENVHLFEHVKFDRNFFYGLTKRIFDIAVSFTLIVFLVPLFVLVGLIIKISDRGSIFYVQKRVGKNGKVFNMLKFRSMCVDADKKLAKLKEERNIPQDQVLFKIKNDPRITRIGRFMRRTSIDELPQLFNVLFGTMTLVGPRPAMEHEVKAYNSYQRQRLCVKQGITCLWQVNGRSNIDFEGQVGFDLEYIKKRSIFYDFYILLRTIKAVISGDGAM